jgi:hypothetical protein
LLPTPDCGLLLQIGLSHVRLIDDTPKYSVAESVRTCELPSIEADLAILATPLAGRHCASLADALRARAGCPLMVAEPGAMARGALRAARRIGQGIAHYLDRLDQISLAVSRPEGPVFEDLIPADATVPGNREYVSAPITNMVWPVGMTHANFFIRKGGMRSATGSRPR